MPVALIKDGGVFSGALTIDRGSLRGLTNISAGASIGFTGSATVLGPLAADGQLEAAAGSMLAIGSSSAFVGTFRLGELPRTSCQGALRGTFCSEPLSLRAGGVLSLEADDTNSSSGRRQLEVVTGHLSIGDGTLHFLCSHQVLIFQAAGALHAHRNAGCVFVSAPGGLDSTGHIRVPADSSLSFNGAGTSTIGGSGIDSAGTLNIAAGSLAITAGGIRSDGAIAVTGGALALHANSLIAGSGLSVSGAGSLAIHAGEIDFRAPLDLSASSAASVTIGTGGSVAFTTGSGSGCGSLTNCQDGVTATAIDCAGAYSDWSECSMSCGGGTESRSYTVTMLARDGGSAAACTAADGAEDARACNTQACPTFCVGSYGPAGACSADCGTGTTSRLFSVSTPAANGGAGCEAADGSTSTADCEAADACDPCDGVTCAGNGFCSGGACTCVAGFTGADCSVDAACTVDCGAHGYCDGATGGCICNLGFTGDACATAPADPCAGVECGNGFCTSDGTCTCLQDYTGPSCSVPISDADGTDSTTPHHSIALERVPTRSGGTGLGPSAAVAIAAVVAALIAY